MNAVCADLYLAHLQKWCGVCDLLLPEPLVVAAYAASSGETSTDIRRTNTPHVLLVSEHAMQYARTMEESDESRAYAYVQLGRRNNMHDCTC